MRTLIGSFTLVIVLVIAGCAAESESESVPVEEAPRLFDEKVSSPSVVPDPAPFVADHTVDRTVSDARRLRASTDQKASPDPR